MLTQNQAIQAIEDNPETMWRIMATYASGAQFDTIEGATLVSLPFPHRLFNSVLSASLADVNQSIAAVSKFFADLQRPWCWIVGPRSQPLNLGQRLLDNGFTHSHDTPGMAIDLRARELRPGHPVLEVTNDAELEEWLKALTAGFSMPDEAVEPFRELLAAVGWERDQLRLFYTVTEGRPTACSMNFYGAGVCGIYCVATVPEARRQGLGEAVVNRCLSAAIEDGCETAILHSSSMGLPLYQKLGFIEYCKLAYYNPPA